MMRIATVTTLCLGIYFVTASSVHAQRQAHVFLPPTRGVTAMSTYIDAQAHYNATSGDYLESVAIARLLHAQARIKESEAFNAEIENRRRWLKYYFEKRILWRDYRRQLDPSEIERTKKKDKDTSELLAKDPAIPMKKNLIATMNWVLVHLATQDNSQDMLLNPADRKKYKEIDLELRKEDISELTLCLAETLNGQSISFPADQGSSLTSKCPLVFHKATFSEKRAQLETLRKQIIEDCADGSIDYSVLESAKQFLTHFREDFDREYPKKQRVRDPKLYFEHKSAVDFLNVQQAAIRLAVESNNVSGLNGDYAFRSNSLVLLLQHMTQKGIEFASPSVGQRHVYEKIFLGMRNIYLHFN